MSAFPEALNLSTKPSAVPARSYRQNISPINGNLFQPSSVIKIDLPTGGSTFLNNKQSYLKFNVNAAVAQVSLPGSAYGMIQKLEIYHAGNLLESISEYGNLCNLFMDAQAESGWRTGAGSVVAGTTGALAGVAIAADATGTFTIPLMSGVIGSHLSKYCPLAFVDSAPIRVEITLCNAADVVGAAGATWTVTDMEFVSEIVELGGDAMRMLRQATNGGPVEISAESFRTYNSALAAGTTSIAQLVPAKFSSLKALFATYRPDGNIGVLGNNPMARTKPIDGVTTQFRVGSPNMPQKPMSGDGEHYSETLKSLHALSDVSTGGTITAANYALVGNGRHAIGIELETFSHATSVLESGVNTLSQSVYLDQNFGAGLAAAQRLDVYAMFDQFLVVTNGEWCSLSEVLN